MIEKVRRAAQFGSRVTSHKSDSCRLRAREKKHGESSSFGPNAERGPNLSVRRRRLFAGWFGFVLFCFVAFIGLSSSWRANERTSKQRAHLHDVTVVPTSSGNNCRATSQVASPLNFPSADSGSTGNLRSRLRQPNRKQHNQSIFEFCPPVTPTPPRASPREPFARIRAKQQRSSRPAAVV